MNTARRLETIKRHRGLVGLCVAYVAFQLINIVWVGSSLPSDRLPGFNDSLVLLRASGEGWLTADLWTGTFPFSYPVLIKLVGTSLGLYVAQAGLAAVVWVWMAIEVSLATASRRLGLLGAAWVLGLSLAPEVSLWHQVIMSESLSSSGLVLLMALALAFWRTRMTTLLVVAVPVTILWIQVRASNVLVLAAFALVLGAWALRTKRRAFVAVALVGMVVVVSSLSLSSGYGKYQTLKWVVSTGVNDPDTRDFLVARGMPDDAAVLDLGSDVLYRDRVAADPRLGEFREWMVNDASRAYAEWLVSDPAHLFAEAFRSFEVSLVDQDVSPAFQGVINVQSVQEPNWALGMGVGSALWLRGHPYLVGWIVLTLLGAGVVQWQRPSAMGESRWLVGWFGLALSPLLLWVSYFGDTADALRQALGASIQLRLALVLLGVWAADTYLARAQPRTPAETSGGVGPAVLLLRRVRRRLRANPAASEPIAGA